MAFAKELHHIKDWLFLGSEQQQCPMGSYGQGIFWNKDAKEGSNQIRG
jgi:hypothetical protein